MKPMSSRCKLKFCETVIATNRNIIYRSNIIRLIYGPISMLSTYSVHELYSVVQNVTVPVVIGSSISASHKRKVELRIKSLRIFSYHLILPKINYIILKNMTFIIVY